MRAKKWDGMKKVLIINPWNASTRKTAKPSRKKKTDANTDCTTEGNETPGQTSASIGTTTPAATADVGTTANGGGERDKTK